jgi:Protein of unknown function (DUF1573)
MYWHLRTSLGLLLLPALGGASPLECSQEAPNFGIVARGATAQLKLICRNTAKTTLVLETPGSSCPCLQASISRERLSPGESMELHLTLATDELSGKSQFYLAIPLHGAMEGAKILQATAQVKSQVIAIPEFVDMGNLQHNSVRQVLVLDTSGSPLELRQSRVRRGLVIVRTTSAQFLQRDGHWQATQSKGAVRGYLLEIQTRPGNAERGISDEVELEFENSSQRTLRLRVTGFNP